MTALADGWRRWVRWCFAPTDARPLALVRILVPLVVIFDQLQVAWLGLVTEIYRGQEHGGLTSFHDAHYALDPWLGSDTGPVLWMVVVACMVFVAAGVQMRLALIIGVLAYAQLGHLYPPGDRGIDRILRTVLLILMFSGCDRCYSLRSGEKTREIPAWSTWLLLWFLALMYCNTGWAKLNPYPARWLSPGEDPVLYRILVNPMTSDLDPQRWAPLKPLFVLGAWGTIALELGALAILTRWRRFWAVGGALLHLGIAGAMSLGVFSWGMLALYPVLMKEWLLPVLDRVERWVGREGS